MKSNRTFVSLLSIRRILIIAVAFFAIEASAALTAQQVAQKAAATVSSPSGLAVSFTLTSGGKTMKGVVKSAGQKFSVLLPQVSTWYNGKSLYTYNPRTSETMVVTPTAQELLESNPLLYVKGGGLAVILILFPL